MVFFRVNMKLLVSFHSTLNRKMLVWRVLWEHLLVVIKFLLSFMNIVGYRHVHMPKSIIPVNGQTTVMFTFLVGGAFKISTYWITEMIRIVIRPVFYAKIVKAEAKFCWPLVMTSEADCSGYWLVSVWLKAVFQVLTCQYGRLSKTRHALLDFDVNIITRRFNFF